MGGSAPWKPLSPLVSRAIHGRRSFIHFCAALLALPLGSALGQEPAPEPVKISLWSNHAPVGDGTFQSQDPVITVHTARPSQTAPPW